MEEKKKRGRPKKDDGRKISKLVLMSVEENELIREASERSGRSQSDIMREASIKLAEQLIEEYPSDWELGLFDEYPEDGYAEDC